MQAELRSGVSTPDPASSRSVTVCVFCGAYPGTSPAHLAAARELARALHENNINLVYGGGTSGVMGEIARTLVSLSGPKSVHGVIPAALMQFEQNSSTVPDEAIWGKTTVVEDMHTRKQLMAKEVIEGGAGGGFIALSGGYGTLEELMEVVTWNQLGIHRMGVVIYNVEGYYNGLLQWVGDAVEAGFVGKANQGIIVEAKTADEVVKSLREYRVAEGVFKLQWGKQ